jgi:hypothetical protein
MVRRRIEEEAERRIRGIYEGMVDASRVTSAFLASALSCARLSEPARAKRPSWPFCRTPTSEDFQLPKCQLIHFLQTPKTRRPEEERRDSGGTTTRSDDEGNAVFGVL